MTFPTLTYDRTARVVEDPRSGQRKSVTLLRPVFGAETYGKQAMTFETPVVATMTVQPASGDDLELLPEGQRLNNVQAVWHTAPLYVANGKDKDSDVLEVDGVRFTVIKLFNRSPNGYYKVLAEGYVHG